LHRSQWHPSVCCHWTHTPPVWLHRQVLLLASHTKHCSNDGECIACSRCIELTLAGEPERKRKVGADRQVEYETCANGLVHAYRAQACYFKSPWDRDILDLVWSLTQENCRHFDLNQCPQVGFRSVASTLHASDTAIHKQLTRC
jgi:hypothetical protein